LNSTTSLDSTSVSISEAILPVGSPSTPTTVSGPYYGSVPAIVGLPLSASLCPSNFGDVTSDVLALNIALNNGSTSTYSYISDVMSPGGKLMRNTLPNSAFLEPPSPTCGVSSGSLLEVRGITDTNGGYGGGTVSVFNLSSASTTDFTTTTGSGTYTVPTGEKLSVNFVSDSIGVGVISSLSSGASSGIAVDVSKSLIVTVSVPNSDVSTIW
jgi:hypothetical protein